ncbi:MAG TPA: TIGR03435 family protein [Vicinamibacterales bacterium]|nr:TIGR03435 family protein [Vicinamibacterales bacterium]
MVVVSVTAMLMSGVRFVTDPTPGGRQFSMLLFYIAILTGAGMWAGLRVLGAKQRTSRGPAIDIAWAAVLTSSGALTAIYGFAVGHPLFVAFSTIGLLNGGGQLSYWLRRPTVSMHWWFAHMGNMLGACIAATTAFAIAGGRRVGLPGDSLITWLGPTAIGLPAIAIWIAYYHRDFAGRRARATQPVQTAARTATLFVVAALLWPAAAHGQTLAPGTTADAFDVASVKPNMSGPQVPLPRLFPDGQLRIIGVTLRDLIRMAYPSPSGEVTVEDGPSWITSDRFDVVAKTTGTPPTAAMLQRLLQERFTLQVRQVTREGSVFALVLARRDGRLGPSMQETSCVPADAAPAVFNDSREQGTRGGQGPATDCSTFRIGGGPTFFAENITMPRFAAILSEFPMLGNSPVRDGTGLTGTYSFQLRTRAENNPNPDAGSLMPAALEEQLGLRLERRTGPVDVVIVERVTRPEAD